MNTADSPKADGAAPTDFAPSWFVPPAGDAIAAPADADDPRPALRLWRLLLGARLLVATALLALEGAAWWWGNGPGGIVALCVAYLGLTAAGLALPLPPARSALAAPRWLVTVWADLAFFAVLELFAPGGINFTPLFVWPVLLAAVLGPRLLALGCASAGTLVLLAGAWRDSHAASTADWLQAGVTGTGLLIVALLASHLTARLAGEQRSAQRNRRLAAIQGEVNRLIVTGLGEGVVVLDAQGAVWYANHAAARMLGAEPAGHDSGTDPATALRHAPAWPVLTGWARATLAESGTPAHTAGRTQDVTLPCPPANSAACACAPGWRGCRASPPAPPCCFWKTCTTSKCAYATKNWPPWAASPPRLRMKSATRWPPSPRPVPCCMRTRPRRPNGTSSA
ncbi:MAG: PAS domain-containing protein [Tepidimonas sp.]